jgi:16S rRNA A1518/A1519 N6-dimethyltransferase RsmA/KsgA/DIM1 with predicted DNA glycosylase/AP lyase activity
VSAVRIRAALGQNFLRHAALARLIVQKAQLRPGTRVYDLGAGTGTLTHEIVRTGAPAIAVERDANLARKLRNRFAAATNVTVIEGDLLQTRFVAPFAVIANIPFSRTAALLRRLLFEPPRPEEALLLIQREAAEKYTGDRLSLVSLAAMPWFDVRIVHHFARSDFVPAPGVDTVLLHITPHAKPRLSESERPRWEGFVRHVLGRTRPDARGSFRKVLSHLQWRLLCRDLKIAEDARLEDLTKSQWVEIYAFFLRHAPPDRQRLATFAALGR